MSMKKVLEFETTISKIIKKNEELGRFKIGDEPVNSANPSEN